MNPPPSSNTYPWGVLFDWDGVIVDSSAHHEQSWHLLAAEHGQKVPEGGFKKSFGMKNEHIIPNLFQWTSEPARVSQMSLRKEELYRELLKSKGITPLPGVLPWLKKLKAAGIPTCIASSTHRLNILTSLDTMGISEFFSAMVTSEDVRHGKPDPEVFLAAATKINRDPRLCVVFEDAMVGVQAARAGGMKVIALTTTHDAKNFSECDMVLPNFLSLGIHEVDALFNEKIA
jgi:beta-phosphoglucomutase family hydrolase